MKNCGKTDLIPNCPFHGNREACQFYNSAEMLSGVDVDPKLTALFATIVQAFGNNWETMEKNAIGPLINLCHAYEIYWSRRGGYGTFRW